MLPPGTVPSLTGKQFVSELKCLGGMLLNKNVFCEIARNAGRPEGLCGCILRGYGGDTVPKISRDSEFIRISPIT